MAQQFLQTAQIHASASKCVAKEWRRHAAWRCWAGRAPCAPASWPFAPCRATMDRLSPLETAPPCAPDHRGMPWHRQQRIADHRQDRHHALLAAFAGHHQRFAQRQMIGGERERLGNAQPSAIHQQQHGGIAQAQSSRWPPSPPPASTILAASSGVTGRGRPFLMRGPRRRGRGGVSRALTCSAANLHKALSADNSRAAETLPRPSARRAANLPAQIARGEGGHLRPVGQAPAGPATAAQRRHRRALCAESGAARGSDDRAILRADRRCSCLHQIIGHQFAQQRIEQRHSAGVTPMRSPRQTSLARHIARMRRH